MAVDSENFRRKGWATDLAPTTQKDSQPIEKFSERAAGGDAFFSSSPPNPPARRHLPLDNARQRIREQAKTMVEQRKMAKRLSLMSRAEEKRMTEEEMEEEIGRGDAQIEQSIKLGAKYVGESQLIWEDKEEKSGGNGAGDVEKGEGRHRGTEMLVTLARPMQCSTQAETKFKAMLKWTGEGGRQMGDKRRPTKVQPPAELPEPVFADQSPPWSDQSLLLWSAPVSWSRWAHQRGTRQWARTRLCLDIHRLEFDHHWLFTGAELRERKLLRAYEAFVETHEKALKAAKEWLMAREGSEEAPRGKSKSKEDDEEERQQNKPSPPASPVDQMGALHDTFLQVQKELNNCVAVLEGAWNDVDKTRCRFVLHRLEGHAEIFEECEGGVPVAMHNFFRSPLFLLSERASDESSANGTTPSENEVHRKRAAIACHYQVQILFNDLFVCASDPVPLHWPSFCVPFGRILDLQVFEPPEQIRIRLLERLSRMGKWQEIAQIFLPLPAVEEGKAAVAGFNWWPSLVGIHFASTIHRGGIKNSLGCGGGQPDGTVLFMQGRLFCALKSNDAKRSGRSTGKEQWDMKKKATDRRPLPPSLFPHGALLSSAEFLSSDLRLNALEKRWLNRDGRPQQRIGLDDGRIIGTDRIKLMDEELTMSMAGEELIRDMRQKGADVGLEAQKRTGRAMALALRHNIRLSDERWRRGRDLGELVREVPLPALSLLPQLLISRRPIDFSRRLKPMRRHPLLSVQRRPIHSAQHLVSRRLIVNIQFANFVPNRLPNDDPSQIFLRFTTKEDSANTTIVDGRHANWQETLVIGLSKKPAEDEAEKGMEEEEEGHCLELDMFDVQVRPMECDDRERDTRHEREERRWLGMARVPLRGLIALGKADGHLALQSPVFHTGYRSHPTDHPITVRLLITVEPSPPLPPQSVGQFVVEECDNLLSEGAQFENRFRQRFPQRRILAIVCATDGQRLIAARFLRPVDPPPRIVSLFSTNPKQAVSTAAQICASVPIIGDSCDGLAASIRTPIWCTVAEILRFGTATVDELGTLLCCWLLSLQLPVLLLLGASLSDGPNSAVVHVKFPDGDQWLVLPSTGHHFAPSDPACPFLSVGTVLCANNVYVNLQNGVHPSQLDFDLANRAHWASLMSPLSSRIRSAVALLPSVQPETVCYPEFDEGQLMELRTSLERDVRLRFDKARPFAIPQWNMLASRVLREVLADSLKSFPDHSGSVSRFLEIESRLDQLRPAFRPSALAFRFPFFSRAQIVHQVLRTQVHLNSDPQAQFALAIHLQPMAGNAVLGCAVAIGTLLPYTQMPTRTVVDDPTF